MDLFDINKRPPKWLLEFHKGLSFFLIITAILLVAAGGIYYTAQWVLGNSTIVPLLISIIGIPLIYVLFLKPWHYVLQEYDKKR